MANYQINAARLGKAFGKQIFSENLYNENATAYIFTTDYPEIVKSALDTATASLPSTAHATIEKGYLKENEVAIEIKNDDWTTKFHDEIVDNVVKGAKFVRAAETLGLIIKNFEKKFGKGFASGTILADEAIIYIKTPEGFGKSEDNTEETRAREAIAAQYKDIRLSAVTSGINQFISDINERLGEKAVEGQVTSVVSGRDRRAIIPAETLVQLSNIEDLDTHIFISSIGLKIQK